MAPDRRAYNRQWRRANPDKVLAYNHQYKDAHADKVREAARRYRADNADKYRAYWLAARAKKRAAGNPAQ